MRRLSCFLMVAMLVTVMVALPYVQSTASVPSLVNYQGILTDGSGTPQVGGPFNITFSIYDDASAANPALWFETQPVMTDAEGKFNVLLGSVTPLTDVIFSGDNRWLGTRVSPDPTDMLPRTRIATVAYAFRPATVDGATGGTIISKVSIGLGHTNTGSDAFVAGNSNVASALLTTVSGGNQNTASAAYASVSGGVGNEASGFAGAIGGGQNNEALVAYSTACGGLANISNGPQSAIGGGNGNNATGSNSTIAGGQGNAAAGFSAAVGGGHANVANGNWATIPGGENNLADHDFSFAAGQRAKSLHQGTFVWGDNTAADFASTGVGQFLVRAAGGVGINTNAPYVDLTVDGTLGFTNLSTPEIFMFESGTASPNRMILSHSPDFPDYGLQYRDVGDKFVFLGNGLPAMTVALSTTGGLVGFGGVTSPTNIITLPNTADVNGQGLANAWVTYSSRRWKRDIHTIDGALDKVERLRGVTYRPKDGGAEQIGLIAEEVGEVVPQVVQYEENGVDAQSIDYARLVSVLIEAVKEQQAEITRQRLEIDELKEKISP